MANWALTDYAIEGPIETLKKIEQAILDHPVREGSDEKWEGNILTALGIEWVDRYMDPKNGLYMRGFVEEPAWYTREGQTLRFSAMEAWDVTDFWIALERGLPGIKVYWRTEEEGCEIFSTNDVNGYYFPERYMVEVCLDGKDDQEYFVYQSDLFKWLYKLTNGKVNTLEKAEEFNREHEDPETLQDDYIYIHEFQVVEPSPKLPIEAAVPEDSPSGQNTPKP